MGEMDGRHGAWLAKQFKCLDDRKKRDRWDAAVPRNGWKLSSLLWLIIAKELLDSFGDINHNYTGDVFLDPKEAVRFSVMAN